MKRKVRVGLTPSLNYNKVVYEIEEDVEFDNEVDYEKHIDSMFKRARDTCMNQFEKWAETVEARKQLERQRG